MLIVRKALTRFGDDRTYRPPRSVREAAAIATPALRRTNRRYPVSDTIPQDRALRSWICWALSSTHQRIWHGLLHGQRSASRVHAGIV